jgi:excisionase family DNA binding protein
LTERPELLTPKQAADFLNVRPSWPLYAARAGIIPCVRLGKHVRFVRQQLEEWVLEQSKKRG